METIRNQIGFEYASIDEAFPQVEPGVEPLGSRVLVQIRAPKSRTKGGIILTDGVRETDAWNTQIAKVLDTGELAFRNRNTQDPWPEGDWCKPGDFVRVPKYGGDRWSVDVEGHEDPIVLVIFNDLDMIARVTGDPLATRAFL